MALTKSAQAGQRRWKRPTEDVFVHSQILQVGEIADTARNGASKLVLVHTDQLEAIIVVERLGNRSYQEVLVQLNL